MAAKEAKRKRDGAKEGIEGKAAATAAGAAAAERMAAGGAERPLAVNIIAQLQSAEGEVRIVCLFLSIITK